MQQAVNLGTAAGMEGCINISIVADGISDDGETFTVEMQLPNIPGVVAGVPSTATVLIRGELFIWSLQ